MASIGVSEVIDAEGRACFQPRIEARRKAIARPAAQSPRESYGQRAQQVLQGLGVKVQGASP